jgi:hypothetical protein
MSGIVIRPSGCATQSARRGQSQKITTFSQGFPSLHHDLFRGVLRRLDLRNRDRQDAILALAANGLGVDIVRQGKATLENSVVTLDAMEFLVLVVGLLSAFAEDREYPLDLSSPSRLLF